MQCLFDLMDLLKKVSLVRTQGFSILSGITHQPVEIIKATVHLKMKSMLLLTHSHVVPNSYAVIFSMGHIRRLFMLLFSLTVAVYNNYLSSFKKTEKQKTP